MLLGRELEDLKAGTFRLECPTMILSNRDEVDPQEFAGPGEVHFDAGGQLELVLYDRDHQVDLGRLFPFGLSGAWLPRSELFQLQATDLGGTVWTAHNLRPDTNAHVDRRGAVVRAQIQTLATESPPDRDGKDWLWLYFAERIDTPANVSTVTTIQESDQELPRKGFERNVWTIACEGLNIRLRRGEAGFEINALAEARGTPAGLDTRLEEALWFCLGQPLTADIVQFRLRDRSGTVVHSRGRSEKLPTAFAPYSASMVDSATVLADIFCKYLQYVSKYREQRFHPLSVLIRKELRARGGTIEERALALSVAIEGVLHHGFQDMGKPEAAVVKAVCELEALLEDHLKLSVLKERVEGFLGAVTRPSPRTALRTLRASDVVTEEQVNAWERLRHVAAHGKEYELPFRQLYEMSQHLLVLLNVLVFELIGYDGPYTDYGAVGWPTRRSTGERAAS